MLERASREWENHLLFRDYLRQHPQAVEAYTALKRQLAEQFPQDRNAYTDGKAAFVQNILRLARAEADGTE